MSKLYTEEEIRKLLNEMLLLSSSVDDAINSLTPIELPTVEEIYINSNVNSENTEQHIGFIKGIQLMRELIKNNK